MGKHLVPQHYLRGFSIQSLHGKPSLFVYKKNEDDPKELPIKNIEQSQKYWSDDVEQFLTREIENVGNPILDKIRREKIISYQDKRRFAVYLASMIQRVRNWREKITLYEPIVDRDLIKEIDDDIDRKINIYPNQKEELETVREKVKDWFMNNRSRISKDTYEKTLQSKLLTKDLGDIIYSMHWRFFINMGSSFVTSNNPVFFPEEVGLSHISSELTFPISPRLALVANWNQADDRTFVFADQQEIHEINKKTMISSSFVFSGIHHKWITSFWKRIGEQ